MAPRRTALCLGTALGEKEVPPQEQARDGFGASWPFATPSRDAPIPQFSISSTCRSVSSRRTRSDMGISKSSKFGGFKSKHLSPIEKSSEMNYFFVLKNEQSSYSRVFARSRLARIRIRKFLSQITLFENHSS